MPNQTGPKTPEGKHTSSQNNRRHGLATANVIVLPEERPYFDQIEAGLRDEICPGGPLETVAFRRLITANWQMEKCQQTEALLIAEEPNEQNKANLEKVRRYYLRWEGSYNSAFRQIRLLQTDRGCQAYMSGDAPDSFAPLADLPKIEQYARRIASHKSFEAKIFDVVINKLAAQEKRTPGSTPDAPVRPLNPTLCGTKPIQNPQPERRVATSPVSPAAPPSAPPLVDPILSALCETKHPKVGRNSLCPCGSGKKYKRCCGVNAQPILNRAA